MNEVFWIPIVALSGSFLMIVAVVWLITRSKQRGAQYRAEVQMKMIDKFGSVTEFTQFLESPAGRQFLNEPRRSARDRAIGGVRTGIILLFIGCGFAVGYWAEHDPGFFIPAFILVGLGIGFLISSAVSFKLAKQWDNTQPPLTP
jgi:hypothetical protein